MITRKCVIHKGPATSTVYELGTINGATGVNMESASYIRTINYLDIAPSTSYTVSNNLTGSFVFHYYDASKVFLDNSMGVSNDPDKSFTLTSPASAQYMRIVFTSTELDIQVTISPSVPIVV